MTSSQQRVRVAASLLTLVGLASAQMLASCSGDDTTAASDGGADAAADQSADVIAQGDGGGDGGSDGGHEASTVATAIAAGTDQVCVVLADKAVRCWGSNFTGESGQAVVLDDAGDAKPILTGTVVPGLSNVSSLSLGASHSCALTAAGQLYCWGSNQFGQLAQPSDGGDLMSVTPVQVTLPGTTAQVAAGFYYTCARAGDGTVRCWGENDTSQLGATASDGGSLGEFVATPTAAAVTGVTSLDTGGRFTCALFGDGGVSCWGDNSQGQLGRGGSQPFNPQSSVTPAPVIALGALPDAGDASVTGLGRSTAYSEGVVMSDKTVRSWGYNGLGGLGPGAPGGLVGTPAPNPVLHGVVELGLGYGAACALIDDGTVACWGSTAAGAAGVDPGDAGAIQTTPHTIEGLTDATHVAVGWDGFACATRKTGAVVCWGNNVSGQLGRGVDGKTLPFDYKAAPVKF